MLIQIGIELFGIQIKIDIFLPSLGLSKRLPGRVDERLQK